MLLDSLLYFGFSTFGFLSKPSSHDRQCKNYFSKLKMKLFQSKPYTVFLSVLCVSECTANVLKNVEVRYTFSVHQRINLACQEMQFYQCIHHQQQFTSLIQYDCVHISSKTYILKADLGTVYGYMENGHSENILGIIQTNQTLTSNKHGCQF